MVTKKKKKWSRKSKWNASKPYGFSSKAMKARGGFVGSSGRRGRITVGKPAKLPGGSSPITGWVGARGVANLYLKRIAMRMGTAAWERYGPRLATYLEAQVNDGISRMGKKAKSISKSDNQPFRSTRPMPMFEQSKVVRAQNPMGASFSSKKYSTSISAGYRPSKSLNLAAQAYGTFKLEKFNTLAEFISSTLPDPTPPEPGTQVNQQRLDTQTSFGFNQKAFFFFNSQFCTNVSDVRPEFGIDPSDNKYNFPRYQAERLYGLIQGADTQIKIANSNAFYPINIKIHMIAIDNDDSYPGLAMANRCFSDDILSQDVGKVPNRFQFSTVASDSMGAKVLVSRKCRLDMATNFRNDCRIVNTTSKRLQPGDVWNYNVKETFGSGIDIQMTATLRAQLPLHYTYVMELSGMECEGVQQHVDFVTEPTTFNTNPPTQATIVGTYIGTSPGEISFEGRRSITYVNNPNPDFPTSSDPDEGMKPTAAIKLYVDKPVQQKEFNVAHDRIGQYNQIYKDLFIPVITDKQYNTAFSTVGPDKSGTETSNQMQDTNQILSQIRDSLQPLNGTQLNDLMLEDMNDQDDVES